jgi:hypothetical protein
MIEQLAAALSPSTSAVASADSVGAAPLAQLSATDVERFRAAMIAPQTEVAAPELQSPAIRAALSAQSTPVDSPMGAGAGGPPPVSSIGESILSGLKSVSDDTRARYRQIAEVLSDPAPSISDLMSLQFVILQNSLQFELTSKLISKAPQTIDSIVKTQ